MRAVAFWVPVLAMLGMPLAAQEQRSPLKDLPSLQVAIDRPLVPNFLLTDSGAESLRQRVISHLRTAGVAVTDRGDPDVTWCQVVFGPTCPVSQPTLFVSVNMVPDGCAFVANVYVELPVHLAGDTATTSIAAYASRSYVYETGYRNHSPVLSLLDDFIAYWRAVNSRED